MVTAVQTRVQTGATVRESTPQQMARYVLVPADNAVDREGGAVTANLISAFSGALRRTAAHVLSGVGLRAGAYRVLDTAGDDETRLVEMTPAQATKLALLNPDIRVAPERIFELLRARTFSAARTGIEPARGSRQIMLRLTDAAGNPLPGIDVDVLVDRQRREVLPDLKTDGSGEIAFSLLQRATKIDLISVVPLASFWGASYADIELDGDLTVIERRLDRIEPGHADAIDLLCGPGGEGAGAGVRVAIIDSGASLPESIPVVAGINTVEGESEDDVADNGTGHGTHVAGIVHRLVPGAALHIYRVCAWGSDKASESALARAIRHAIDQGCDIINISLGQPNEPLAARRAARQAFRKGVVVVAATGNGWGSQVDYPARTESVLAVTACGLERGAPTGVIAADVLAPPPDLADDGVFFARFSSVGPSVTFVAPGVAIVSPVSRNEVGAMDGTSMACPATSGLIARLLSADPALLNSPRDEQRVGNIVAACRAAARPFGFGGDNEGSGMIISGREE